MAYSEESKALAADTVWNRSIDVLRSELDPQIFAAWIKPLEITSLGVCSAKASETASTREVELAAPNKFCCEHVRRHYEGLISSTLNKVMGAEQTVVHFRVREGKKTSSGNKTTTLSKNFSVEKLAQDVVRDIGSRPAVVEKKASPRAAVRRSAPRGRKDESNLNPKYNFSNYVVGHCNQFPHAVSLRVAESPGSAYNPLFIYGGVGLGKTHLVNAIGNAARRRGKKALLVSSEIFVNELISALRSNRMDKFKSKFRSLDLLIIDDIQFIIGKERTQEEFFHTFNDLYHRHKQIVITSDRVPQELTGLEERLRTRFASGLTADLQPPDFETRVAILVKKAELGGIELPNDVAGLLAEKIDTNVRELEGALNRLHALSSLHEQAITLPFAEEALENFVPDRNREITTEEIQRIVAEKYNVSINDILGKRRTQNIAFARHVAMFLCRTLTGCSYPEIGALFGGRDHSTVIHAFRVTEEKMKANPAIDKDIQSLRKKLES